MLNLLESPIIRQFFDVLTNIKMLIKFHICCLFFALLFFANTANAKFLLPNTHFLVDHPHSQIELKALINTSLAEYVGRIGIIAPQNIKFSAQLIATPKKATTQYLYTALSVMEITPLPSVNYQAFISADESNTSRVIAVYLEDKLAEELLKMDMSLLNAQSAIWYGYHIYNYSRGPAIVIENIELLNIEDSQ